MTNLKLSFIILNYKTKHLLRLALRNLTNLNLQLPHEIIVVDNASNDGSVEMVRELYPDIQLIASDKNTGHAAGNNVGIKVAKGQYVMIMNSDIIIQTPDTITRMVEYLDLHPEVALLGPQLRNADGTIQHSCFRPYSTFTPFYRRTPLGRLPFAQQDLANHLMLDFDHSSIQSVEWLLGAVLLARKAVLDEVGGLNESFFLYFADYELCDRVRAHGYNVVYFPNASMVHYHRRESAQASFWGGLGSVFNYATRIHLKDWLMYLKTKRSLKRKTYGQHA